MSQADTVALVPSSIDKDKTRGSISMMKNRKLFRSSNVVPEIVKAAVKVGVDIITDLVNQKLKRELFHQNGKWYCYSLLQQKGKCFRKRKLYRTVINRSDTEDSKEKLIGQLLALVRCSLISCQDAELQMSFSF